MRTAIHMATRRTGVNAKRSGRRLNPAPKGAYFFAASVIYCLISAFAVGSPAPSIDGFVNDPFWSEKGRTWTLFDPQHPETVARCFLGYDDQYLYFAADIKDTNVVGTNRTAKSRAWEDDAIKLLLHTGDSQATEWTDKTFAYTFSAIGGVNWMRGPLPADADPSLEPGWPSSWDSEMKWAVVLKAGTMPNVTGKPDNGYAVEARIPWSELGLRTPFRSGSTISVCIVNICRPDMSLSDGKPNSSVPAAREVTPLIPNLWERVPMDWYGPLAMRGMIEPLPLWLGSPDRDYEAFKSGENGAASLWWNRSHWTARLDRMRSLNMNTLVLRHTNPWTGLAAAAQAETQPAGTIQELIDRTGWFSPDEFERVRDQFRWILSEAQDRGIRVFLLLANEQATSCPTPGTQPDTARTEAQALSHLARQLAELYPNLAGLGAGEGYNSPDVIKALAGGLHSVAPAGTQPTAADGAPTGPELLVWSEGVEPALIGELADQYPGTQVIQPLQGAHWYQPLADSGLQKFARQVEAARSKPAGEPVPHAAVGSLRGALSYVFWADPQWARTLMLDIRNQGLNGFLLDGGPGEHPLAREALFEYAYNAGRRFSVQRWESRLKVYGVEEYAGQLLEAVQHASAVVPELLLLLYDDDPRFMPQFGLLLVHYTELPSYSAFLDEDQPADLRAQHLGSVGPAWPNPVWGRPVATIRSEADRSASGEAVSAWKMAANISSHVEACNSLLPGLRHLKPPSPEQTTELTRLLDTIEFNVVLGHHVASRIKAATGWEQYKARRGRRIDCIQPLQESVEAWRKLCELAERLHDQPVPYWQSQPVSPPPWSKDYLHRTYVPVVGHWCDQLPRFERELNLIRAAMESTDEVRTLPLWDHVNAVPDDKRQTRFVIDFEAPDDRCHILLGASTSHEPRLIGKQSLLIDTRGMPEGRHEVFTTDVGHVPLMSAQKYQVALMYRVIDPGDGDEPFEMGVRSATGGPSIGDHLTWAAPQGHIGSRILQVPPPEQDGNIFYIATRAGAAVIIDEIQIAQIHE